MAIGVNKTSSNMWPVLFNVPNTISWIRLVLMFLSLRQLGHRKYISFMIIFFISGLLDSLDGPLARELDQSSLVGQFFETILDQYAHVIMYTLVGFLYPSWITFFFLEIALELWNSLFHFYIHTLPPLNPATSDWLSKPTFLSSTCTFFSLWHHPNLRWYSWYGPDIFHALLVIRYIFISDNDRRVSIYVDPYITMHKFRLLIRYLIIITGVATLLRTVTSSCALIDRLHRLATLQNAL